MDVCQCQWSLKLNLVDRLDAIVAEHSTKKHTCSEREKQDAVLKWDQSHAEDP